MNMPSIGLGTFRLQGQEVIDSVLTGLEVGYRHIDTAQIYGNETEIGKAIADSGIARGELFITTKIWTENLAASKVMASLQESLDKLRTDHVDLTLIHWPGPAGGVPLEETLFALLEAQSRRWTNAIGVSNFTIPLMEQAIAAVGAGKLMTNQVELHPFLQQAGLVEATRKASLHLTAYMPLAYGKVMSEPVLQRIAAAHGATAAQVSLAYLLQQGFAVIPSSTRRANQESNLAAVRLTLTQEEMEAIRRLDRKERLVNPDFSPAWDE